MTEGVLPILMHDDGFYITGDQWAKFSRKYLEASFYEFLLFKRQKDDHWNASTRAFFTQFESDRVKNHRILLKRHTTRELRHLRKVSEGIEYVAPAGLLEPKVEPVDEEGDIGPPSYMFRGPPPFAQAP